MRERYNDVMRYEVELKPRARKDLRRLSQTDAARVIEAMGGLEDDLQGDVKRLTAFTPEHRLRVGDYRVLFEIEQPNRVVIYRVRHRRDAYRR
jgi:mRNA interferase RelE/StbE